MKWLVGAIVVVALVVAGVYGFLLAEKRTSTDAAGNTVIQFGALPIAVTDDEPLGGRPPIFLGEMVHPEPRFPTEELGDDLTFVEGEPDRSDLVIPGGGLGGFGLFGRAVYLGEDVQGGPVYLLQQTGQSVIDLVKGWFTDIETTGLYGSSYDCCRTQSQEGSAPVFNQPQLRFTELGGQTYAMAEMWGIQDDIAVVVFTNENDQALGWQRPVGGYVGVRFESDSAPRGFPDIRMTTYRADGTLVEGASWPVPGL